MTYGTNNGESDIDAYQFGMGNVVGQGAIQLNPRVQHMGADMLLYFTQYKDCRGFFFKIQAPFGAMRMTTRLQEVVASPDDVPDLAWLSYPAPEGRYHTMTEAWQAGSYEDGVVNSSRHKLIVLGNGRISSCALTAIRMGDIGVTAGYKVYGSQKGFVDIGFKFTCPTGNVPHGVFVLEPIFGRGGNWGVGGEVTGHYKAWENDCLTRGLDLWFQGELLHLAKGRRPSWRSFDLKQNGPGSKYLLIQHYFPINPTTDNPTGRAASFITNAINVTTMPVLSKFAVEGSLAVMLDYHERNWNFGLGGEVWGRSRECLSLDCCNIVAFRAANLNDYAVLGRQISEDARNIFTGSNAIPGDATVVSLHLAEPLARINQSEDRVLGAYTFGPFPNPQPALPVGYDTEKIKDARLAENRIPENLHDALDIAGAAAARAITGKIFGQVGYTWKENAYTPNLSVFSSAEFTGRTNSAVNLWSVGLEGSISF